MPCWLRECTREVWSIAGLRFDICTCEVPGLGSRPYAKTLVTSG